MGGIVLHEGKIAEMRTGEGKTLTATLPVALNALTGRGVHVVTVNDYLANATRSGWARSITRSACRSADPARRGVPLRSRLGIGGRATRIACDRLPAKKRTRPTSPTARTTNSASTTCATTWLSPPSRCVQRDLIYAIVDEVDNILIDEARTPLIISGQAERANDRYYQFAQIVKQLRAETGTYEVDLKHKTSTLTEEGIDKVEQLAGFRAGESIYDERYIELTHYLEQALKAQAIFHRDKDYIVRDGEVIIVDEFTGRMMPGRR